MSVSTHIALTQDGMCKSMIMLLWIQGNRLACLSIGILIIDGAILCPVCKRILLKISDVIFYDSIFKLLVIVKIWKNRTPTLIVNRSQNNLFLSLTLFNIVQSSVFPSYHMWSERLSIVFKYNDVLVMQGHIDSFRLMYEKCILTG